MTDANTQPPVADAAHALESEVEADLPSGLKAGWKTTEFWVTVSMLLGAGFLLYKGQDNLGTIVLTLTGMKYSVIRTVLKLKHGDSI